MKISWVILVCLCFAVLVSAKRQKSASAGSQGGGPRKPASDIIDIDDAHDFTASLLEGSGNGAINTDDEEPDDSDASGDETEELSGDLPPEHAACNRLRAQILSGARTNSTHSVRQFIPKCAPDGQFEPVQCLASSGECWCVNQLDGVELAGSRRPSRFKLSCSPSDAGTKTSSSGVTVTPSERPASTAGKLLLKTFSPTSTSTQIPVKTSTLIASTSTARPASTSTVRSTTTTRISTAASSTVQAIEPDNKINQIPDETGPDIKVDGPDTDNNYVERPNVIIEPKARKMTLRSTIVGQPGILAGIIGAAVIVLICLVLLVMFIIYRMHRKSQDPAVYFIDKPARSSLPSSNKKAGYMKALDHDVYT